MPGGLQMIGDQPAMALPPQRFGAEDREAPVARKLQQPFDAGTEFVGEHVVGVTAKGFAAPGGVRRILKRAAASAEFRKMRVADVRTGERFGERLLIEMR